MTDADLLRFDPLRSHYIDTLRQRAGQQQGEIRRRLEQTLAAEVAALQEDFAMAQGNACPSPAGEGPSPLAELLAYLTGHSASPEALRQGPQSELKSIEAFRTTWSRLSAGRQLDDAIDQAPENAGPLNSHMLVLRALSAMNDASPAYLNRFLAYIDTLLRLEQEQARTRPPAKRATKGRAARS